MTLRSMTGFALAQSEHDVEDVSYQAAWEIKSVNGRGLEARVRVPPLLDGFDIAVRRHMAKRLARGSVAATLTLRGQAGGTLRVNEDRLSQLFSMARKLEGHPGVQPPRLDGLLTLPGVMEAGDAALSEDARAALESALLASLDIALDRLIEARGREGAELADLMRAQLDTVEDLVGRAASTAGARLETIRDRLAGRIAELLDAQRLDPARLEQEAAALAIKQDVREELDRLTAHLKEARTLLAKGGPVGRRLDFLAQEFNREANTLCAKSADTELTRIGLELKAVIDQLREQCQNVE